MKEALDKLTAEQIDFICAECQISKEELFALDEDTLYDRVYDVMCDIELAEIPVSDKEEESERCKMASSIVTDLGNALAQSEGIYDEDDEE